MAEPAAPVAAAENAPEAPEQQNSFYTDLFQNVGRFAMVYLFISNVMKPLLKQPVPAHVVPDHISPDDVATVEYPVYKDPISLVTLTGGASSENKIPIFATHDSLGRELGPHKCIFKPTDIFDMRVFITEHKLMEPIDFTLAPIFQKHGILFDWRKGGEEKLELSLNITPSASLLANQSTLYAHVFFSLPHDGTSPVPLHPNHTNYNPEQVFHRTFDLVIYKKRHKKVNTKLLLEATNASGPVDPDTPEDITLIPNWKPSLALSLVLGMPPSFNRNGVPPTVLQFMDFTSHNGSFYYPVIYRDDFWILSKHLMPINETLTELPLTISYTPIALWKWSMQIQMDAQNKVKAHLSTAASDKENDQFKEILTDTNPWLLGLTMVVSLLHMVFDMLAFKNDIQVRSLLSLYCNLHFLRYHFYSSST